MTKIKVGDLHEKLVAVGIPVATVRLTKAQTIELEFVEGVTSEQKAAAQAIVAGYDQAAENAARAALLPGDDAITSAKTVADLKVLMLQQNALIAKLLDGKG